MQNSDKVDSSRVCPKHCQILQVSIHELCIVAHAEWQESINL